MTTTMPLHDTYIRAGTKIAPDGGARTAPDTRALHGTPYIGMPLYGTPPDGPGSCGYFMPEEMPLFGAPLYGTPPISSRPAPGRPEPGVGGWVSRESSNQALCGTPLDRPAMPAVKISSGAFGMGMVGVTMVIDTAEPNAYTLAVTAFGITIATIVIGGVLA